MLIDVHAHFLHDRTPRADWRERNASRLRAGERVGISWHVASILGSWGATSPTYFPSLADLRYGNDWMLALQRAHPDRIRGWVAVNPNYTDEALAEIVRCLDAGMIGIKLAASRRADD
ncbi:MAG TPA: amidohydrolase family protein, partial [Gemmatimonadales bacterium]|nr:amidohydrolase family protein [Gemmatimonadales bacterium]